MVISWSIDTNKSPTDMQFHWTHIIVSLEGLWFKFKKAPADSQNKVKNQLLLRRSQGTLIFSKMFALNYKHEQ